MDVLIAQLQTHQQLKPVRFHKLEVCLVSPADATARRNSGLAVDFRISRLTHTLLYPEPAPETCETCESSGPRVFGSW